MSPLRNVLNSTFSSDVAMWQEELTMWIQDVEKRYQRQFSLSSWVREVQRSSTCISRQELWTVFTESSTLTSRVRYWPRQYKSNLHEKKQRRKMTARVEEHGRGDTSTTSNMRFNLCHIRRRYLHLSNGNESLPNYPPSSERAINLSFSIWRCILALSDQQSRNREERILSKKLQSVRRISQAKAPRNSPHFQKSRHDFPIAELDVTIASTGSQGQQLRRGRKWQLRRKTKSWMWRRLQIGPYSSCPVDFRDSIRLTLPRLRRDKTLAFQTHVCEFTVDESAKLRSSTTAFRTITVVEVRRVTLELTESQDRRRLCNNESAEWLQSLAYLVELTSVSFT